MLYFHFFSLTSASEHEPEENQLKSMKLFFCGYHCHNEDLERTLVNIDLIKADDNPEDYCKWKGVGCDTQKHMTKLLLGYTGFTSGNIKWLPSTIQELHFDAVGFDPSPSHLETRFLPRELLTLHINNCAYVGEVELRTLPQHLSSANLSLNRFQGTVRLTRLPLRLRTLIMCYNSLRTVVVQNSLLPKGFISASFEQAKKVKFVSLSDEVADCRVTGKYTGTDSCLFEMRDEIEDFDDDRFRRLT
mmetsp:Transcript_27108/g.42169  ORF Transcript_27108/g.42169 Transcript_27108/m.42169 type:complete len:246 (-) Transcript_27108:41-778(-)